MCLNPNRPGGGVMSIRARDIPTWLSHVYRVHTQTSRNCALTEVNLDGVLRWPCVTILNKCHNDICMGNIFPSNNGHLFRTSVH